jgi:hypothetical protein
VCSSDLKEPEQVVPVPVLGPDLLDPRQYEQIRKYAQQKLVESTPISEQNNSGENL